MKVVGEMEDFLILLSANDKVCQYIDIIVEDIPDSYGLVLSRDWSTRLNGYFVLDWSHLWLPHKGSPNQIKILREPQMNHNVTQLDKTNVKVVGEMEDVLIQLSANKKICQYIDIVVADIPNGYGLILNRD